MNILLFFWPTPKKLILPLILIFLPLTLTMIGAVFQKPQLGMIGLFLLYEFPLQILDQGLNLNLPRNCQGGGWLSFCLYSSTLQGLFLIGLIYGSIGYLISCAIFRLNQTEKQQTSFWIQQRAKFLLGLVIAPVLLVAGGLLVYEQVRPKEVIEVNATVFQKNEAPYCWYIWSSSVEGPVIQVIPPFYEPVNLPNELKRMNARARMTIEIMKDKKSQCTGAPKIKIIKYEIMKE